MAIKNLMSPFWLMGLALTMAASWLLPNHYPPWSTFHMDAWMAIVLALTTAVVLARSANSVAIHELTLLAGMLVAVPGIQYGLGLVMLVGTAWTSTAYLLGFFIALLTGAHWESSTPGQVADYIFLAIGIACLLSVGLQLHQWLALDLLNIWSMGDGYGRPFANIGQPNNLGTLLLLGIVALAWGMARRQIGIWTAFLTGCYLLFGLALTQSRTAWLAIVMLIAASWVWRRLWADPRCPWMATAFGLYFVVCVVLLDWLNYLLLLTLTTEASDLVRVSGELRPVVWRLFVDAVLQRPWFGYGWSQVTLAQLNLSLDHPALHVVFSHSHNLFLDLMLWCGVPVGLFISIFLLRWFWQCIRLVRSAQDAVLLFFLMVLGNHAMLELPLHHAYFLFPTGLIMGVLNIRMEARPIIVVAHWVSLAFWLIAVTLLSLIIRDYSRIEVSYQGLRFEWAQIKTGKPGEPSEVLLLTQWSEFIRLARFEPGKNMSAEDLNWVRSVTSTFPSTGGFHKLATALALNRQPIEAELWLRRMCKIVSAQQCDAVKTAWRDQSLKNPAIAAVPWPN